MDEAIDWIVRLKTGEPTGDDLDALAQWRARSPAHEDAFRRATGLYRISGIAAEAVAQKQRADAASWPRRLFTPTMARRAFLTGAVALPAAGYALTHPPFGLWPAWDQLFADYHTSKGEQRQFSPLAGVSVELNTQTSMALRAQRNEAKIELISGEAAVKSTRPSSNPLKVLAAKGEITAADANFDVRCYNDQVSVTCLRGAIDVTQGRTSIRLSENQQVAYSPAGMEPLTVADASLVTAWQSGLLVFRDIPLENAVSEINRYRQGAIIIVNAHLKHRRVNGTFQIKKLDQFVGQVQQLFGAHATSLPGGIVLLS